MLTFSCGPLVFMEDKTMLGFCCSICKNGFIHFTALQGWAYNNHIEDCHEPLEVDYDHQVNNVNDLSHYILLKGIYLLI